MTVFFETILKGRKSILDINLYKNFFDLCARTISENKRELGTHGVQIKFETY